MSQDSGIEDQGCGKAERAMGLGTGFEVSGFGFKDGENVQSTLRWVKACALCLRLRELGPMLNVTPESGVTIRRKNDNMSSGINILIRGYYTTPDVAQGLIGLLWLQFRLHSFILAKPRVAETCRDYNPTSKLLLLYAPAH